MDAFAKAFSQQFWTLTALLMVAAGWLLTYLFNRRLQRRQATVTLLNHLFTSPVLIEARNAVRYVHSKIENFDWKNLRDRVLLAQNASAIPVKALADFAGTSVVDAASLSTQPASPEQVQLYLQFRLLLDFYEYICGGIRSGALSAAVVRTTLCSEMVFTYKSFESFIKLAQDPRHGRSSYYENLEAIATLWRWDKPAPFVFRLWHLLLDT